MKFSMRFSSLVNGQDTVYHITNIAGLPKIKQIGLLIAVFLLIPSRVNATEKIEIKSSIIFNTACARCHEGECSGRMTFHMGKDIAGQHIRRYGGELSNKTTHQLFDLLRYMKEECDFYPIPVSIPVDRVWNETQLSQLKTPSGKGYFIPLGRLEVGTYRLLLQGLDAKVKTYIGIVTGDFEFACEEFVNQDNLEKGIQFEAEEFIEHYLRINGRKLLSLTRIKLIR